MMRLFEGYTGAYGTYESEDKNIQKGGKLEIKKTARTVREPVILALWEKHLKGMAPLGIIPINEKDSCVWGCIDVDSYDVNHADLAKQVMDTPLPMLVCKSKSGGAHIYIFLNEPVTALEMQTKLREIAASLGYGKSEIFPKQTRLLLDKGDLGNWLNMPYFSGDKTTRFAVKSTGTGMTVEEFLTEAEEMRLSRDDFLNIASSATPKEQDIMADGPPCLQYLTSVGFPEGTRNNGLFALGIFAKKKFPGSWKDKIEDLNRQFMDPPLPSDEVNMLIKNLDKKDYNYKCSDQPIVSYCNSGLCRTRKFGVGGGDEFPVIAGMSVLDSEPPLWFVDIEDSRVELTTEQLQNYKLFQRAAMDKLHVCYQMMKQDTWLRMVGDSMRNAVRIEAPKEVNNSGHFIELLHDFCTSKHRARNKDEILLGKPWEDEENKRYYFRLRDLMSYLEREKFHDYARNKVSNELRIIGGRDFWNVKGQGLNLWWVRADFGIPLGDDLDLPESLKDPI